MGNLKTKGKTTFSLKLCAGLLASTFLFAIPSGVTSSASSQISEYEEKIKQIQQEKEERNQQIAELGDDIDDNEEAIGLISDQIDSVNSEIQQYGQLINAKQDEIDAKKAGISDLEQEIYDKESDIISKKLNIKELEAQNKSNLQKFAKLACALYKNDASGTIPVLNGSDDWYNYFVYSDVIKNISSQNLDFMQRLLDAIKEQEKLIDDLNAEVEKLEKDKASLETEKASLESEMDALDSDKSDLESYVGEQRDYLYGIAAENDYLKQQVDYLQYANAEADAELEELNAYLEQLIRQQQQNNSGQVVYGDGFRWPVYPDYKKISTYFGYDPWRNGMHRGIDICGGSIGGANIYAAQSGTVISVSYTCSHNYGKYYSCGCGGGYGNYIVIDHGGGLSTLYAHCATVNVYQGQQVSIGDVIGTVGSTGWSTGDHLHFEVREDGYAVDPFGYTYQDVY